MDEYHSHTRLRIIGDVHGLRDKYLQIVHDANNKGLYTLQLGDLGFTYEYKRLMDDKKFDVVKNKFFRGNHDDYEFERKVDSEYLQRRFKKFCLGDYGFINLNGVSLFFARGGFSVDKKYRTQGRDWWPEEEISTSEHGKIVELYLSHKPDIVVTHECPHSVGYDGVLKQDDVLREFGFEPSTFTTRTQVLLQELFNQHKPKEWYFGHYHRNWQHFVKGTDFRCLNELSYVDV